MKENTIYLGMTLAGAVSAGAYTAGVMDYLFEALDEWEKRKKSDPGNTPQHRVEIPVIGGASAGGMTGIITAAALQDPIVPVPTEPTSADAMTGNKFYDSWVHLTGGNMFDKLLQLDDLSDKEIRAIFNTQFIDEISERAIKTSGGAPVQRDYLSENLKVFATMSNLEGFEYDLSFKSDAERHSEYIVRRHNDYACFVVSNGTYENDGWIPLDFLSGANTDLARQCAIATGAFPIGLRARFIKRDRKYIMDNPWIKIEGAVSPKISQQSECNYLMVDGGMINNEPFGYVNKVLDEHLEKNGGKGVGSSQGEFRTANLMIDPFPSVETQFDSTDSVFDVGGKVMAAMLSQSRTKPNEVIKAFSRSNGAHFLISPKRYFPENNGEGIAREGGRAVACGFLGGFGGFINKQFRVHDFFLGRANCERFLRHQFTVPVKDKHPVIVGGYKHIADRSAYTRNVYGEESLSVIPLFAAERDKPYLPNFSGGDWPIVSKDAVEKYKKAIKTRVGGIIGAYAGKKGWVARNLGFPILDCLIGLKRKASKKFIETVLDDMDKYNLLR